MGNFRAGAALIATVIVMAACSKEPDKNQVAVDKAMALVERLEAERKQLEEEQARRDKQDAPFDSTMKVEALNSADKKRLCGDDYGRIAIGWPIKKGIVCGGEYFVVTTDSAHLRIWQGRDYFMRSTTITIGEQDGRVASWNRL